MRWAGTYWVRSLPSNVSLSTTTPSGGSFIRVISSFCSRLYVKREQKIDAYGGGEQCMRLQSGPLPSPPIGSSPRVSSCRLSWRTGVCPGDQRDGRRGRHRRRRRRGHLHRPPTRSSGSTKMLRRSMRWNGNHPHTRVSSEPWVDTTMARLVWRLFHPSSPSSFSSSHTLKQILSGMRGGEEPTAARGQRRPEVNQSSFSPYNFLLRLSFPLSPISFLFRRLRCTM